MGNCLGNSDKDKTSSDIQSRPTVKSQTKQKWFRLLKVESVVFYPSNYLNKKYQHETFAQIQKDIDRTFPTEPQFHMAETKMIFRQALQEVALYYPKYGYMQGLNFTVGFFILTEMNELQAIRSFIAMTTHPQLMLLGLYEDDFPLARLNCELFWSVFKEKQGDLANKIENLNIPDQLWVFQWFICIYIYSFPRSYMEEILTFIWQDKEFACVKLALAIMDILGPSLKKSKQFQDDFIESMELLKSQEHVKGLVPLRKLIDKARKYDNKLFARHLKTVKIDNWYKHYFSAEQSEQKLMHKLLMAQLQKSRKDYLGLGRSSVKSDNSCLQKRSKTIIDYIEELRVEKINGSLMNSLSHRIVNSSFAVFKQRYSLTDEHQSASEANYKLVQSKYQK